MGLSAIDLEREKVKRLSPEIAAVSPLSPAYVSPKGIYEAVDKIEASSAEKTHQFSPVLPLPHSNYEHFGMTLARLQMKFDKINQLSTELFNEDVEQNQAHLNVLEANYQAALNEELETKKTESYWNTFGRTIQYFASAASLLLGAKRYVSGEEDLASFAYLLAAGGLGLCNQLMADTQGWKTLIGYFIESLEKRQTIETGAQALLFFVSMGLTYNGGLASAQAIFQGDDTTTRTIMLAKELFVSVPKIGAAATRKRARDIQAIQILLQADQTDLLKNLELSSSSNQEMQRGFQQILSVMKKAIEDLSIHE